MRKCEDQMGFADLLAGRRKKKQNFFNQIEALVDFEALRPIITAACGFGKSVTGRPACDAVTLFRIELPRVWYGLSDCEVVDQLADRISFGRFAGISLGADVPDNSVLCRFRGASVKAGAYEKLLDAVNGQPEAKGLVVRTGAIVDASVAESPRRPRGKKYYVAGDRAEDRGDAAQTGEARP